MSRLKDEMIPYITHEEIQELVSGLARQIERDFKGKEIIHVCPLKGSLFFMADLVRQINLPQQVDFVHLLPGRSNGGIVRIMKDITVNITGKHVLILEEIIDTGRTLNFLKTRLIASSPASLNVVALLDKPARRELPIKPDYVGRTIDDRFVVGYGLDSEEIGRNYKDIYYLKH